MNKTLLAFLVLSFLLLTSTSDVATCAGIQYHYTDHTENISITQGRVEVFTFTITNEFNFTISDKLSYTIYKCADFCPWMDITRNKYVDLEPDESVEIEVEFHSTSNTEVTTHPFEIF